MGMTLYVKISLTPVVAGEVGDKHAVAIDVDRGAR